MIYRWIILGTSLIVFAAFSILHIAGYDHLYLALLNGWGIEVAFRPYMPFLDINEFMSALQCSRSGLDVFLTDPCDILARGHVYPVWLTPHLIPLGTADTAWVGTVIGVAFLSSVAFIANPRSLRQTAVFVLAVLSSASAFAVERANMDLVEFILIVIASVIFCRSLMGRTVAYAVIFFAALVKFYPIVAMGIAVRERKTRLIATTVIAAVAWIGFLYLVRHNLAEMTRNLPQPHASGSVFGGADFFYMPRDYLVQNFPKNAATISGVARILYLAASLAAIVTSFRLFRRWGADLAGNLGPQQDQVLFMAGGIVIVSAFFLGVNIAYREIFLLLILPALFSAWRSAPLHGQARRIWAAAIGLTIGLLWFEFFHVNLGSATGIHVFWPLSALLIREPLWWVFIVGLMTLLWAQIAATPYVGKLPIFRLSPGDERHGRVPVGGALTQP